MLNIEIAARTEVGARSHNEDDLKFGSSGTSWYAVLSDGAGGHHGGAIASDLVVRMIALRLQSAAEVTPRTLNDLVCDTHAALCHRQAGSESHQRMHATVVVLWIDTLHEQALWSHVGDSRLYMLRHGRVCGVTRDDSAVQQMMDAGYLTFEEARNHPHKNQLLSAMGTEEAIQPHTVAEPIGIRDGDAFLLCSDGWWDPMDEKAIESTFAVAASADEWLERMLRQVQESAHLNQDNFSAVAVWVGDPAQATRMGGLWDEPGLD